MSDWDCKRFRTIESPSWLDDDDGYIDRTVGRLMRMIEEKNVMIDQLLEITKQRRDNPVVTADEAHRVITTATRQLLACTKEIAWLREALDAAHDMDVLNVLCRVFDDGADVAMDEWHAWYKPSDWLSVARGLGAFIHQRLEAKDSGLIRIRPESSCPTCNGPRSGVFDSSCPAAWAHRFVRSP